MWNPFSSQAPIATTFEYKPTLSVDIGVVKLITEGMKGEVQNKKIKFPEELGEEHPFDFKITEGVYKKFGFFTAVVDKYVDYVIGPGFYVTHKDERILKVINDFMRDVNFDTQLRAWTKEALIKGNGFLELGGDKDKGISGMKILNANYMYVNRDDKGKILGFNQYTGGFKKFDKQKVIPFTPEQIAHVAFNRTADDAYGMGIGYAGLESINYLLKQNKDMHQIMERKANSPLHAKLGKVDGNVKIIPKAADVTAFGKEMETMGNKTNWATDPLVDLSVVDFGNMGDKFSTSLEFDLNMLIYIFQIPAVLLGMANIAEGLAEVQMDGFQRRIQSIQAELEKIIEGQIFKRVLESNGFSTEEHVEFDWGAPSSMEVDSRMKLLAELVKSPMTSPALKIMSEDELINLLKLDKDEWERIKVEKEKEKAEQEELDRELQRAQPIVPGQNSKFPKKPVLKTQQPKQPKPKEMVILKKNVGIKQKEKINYEGLKSCPHCTESIENINDINEWLGFKYNKYLYHILKVLGIDDFEMLKGNTEEELAAGYLTESQVVELKGVMEDGFKKGSGIKEIAKQIDKKVKVKDLYRLADGKVKIGASGLPILSKTAEKRAIGIARTEVTRLANAGAVDYYKENNIKNIRWVASFGERTCVECEGLNDQIFEIGNEAPMPAHPLCRCTYVPVEEIK